MSSSYVEVREAENGTEDEALQFGIDQCEDVGLETQPNVEGELPKDHTYNKDPVVIQGEEATEPEAPKESVSLNGNKDSIVKSKPTRTRKTVKPTKVTKPVKVSNNSKVTKSPMMKKQNPKKKSATLDKKVPSEAKVVEENKELKQKSDSVTMEEPSVISQESAKTENGSENLAQPAKRRGRKRKLEVEKTSVKEKSKVAKKEKEKEIPKSNVTPMYDDPNLPKGWKRKVVQRKSGRTAGHYDVYIYSPDGKKHRSRTDVATYLAKINSSLKYEDFDFSITGKSNERVKSSPVKKLKAVQQSKKKQKANAAPVTPVAAKKRKKATSSTGKKGQKLVVKLNFTSPKKRILSNYEQQNKDQTGKKDVGKSDTSKKDTSTPKKTGRAGHKLKAEEKKKKLRKPNSKGK